MMKPQIRPTKKQFEAWLKLQDKTTKDVLFGGGAGGGKSWLGCEWLITNCYFYPGTRYYVGREELKRLRDSTLQTFFKVAAHHKIPRDDWKLNGQDHFIQFANGSRIDLLDLKENPSDPMYERYGSTEYTAGWIEEAGEVSFGAYDVLKSRIGRCRNDEYGIVAKTLLTCNPKKNWLYQYFYKPWKEGTLPETRAFVQALVGDNQYIETGYRSNLEEINDKVQKQRLLKGIWEYEDDDSLIDFEAIIDLFTNTIEPSDEKFFSADVARFGSDQCVGWSWKGFEATLELDYGKTGTDVTAQKLSAAGTKLKIPRSKFIIDEDGIGGGVIDQFKGCRGFIANSAPIERAALREGERKENYRNLKTQCIYKFADHVNKRLMRVNVTDEKTKQKVIEDLEQMRRKDSDKEGRLEVIAKDEVKEILKRSPDYGDSLMMRMVFELERRTPRLEPGERDYYRVMREKRMKRERSEKMLTMT